MNKTLAFLLGMLGINATSACSQQVFENADVKTFAELVNNPDIQLVDVRTTAEFAEGHIEGALNIDVKSSMLTLRATVRSLRPRMARKQPAHRLVNMLCHLQVALRAN